MQGNNPLENLKDIHVPDEITVSFFPIAYGWWILLTIALLSIIILYAFRRYRLVSVRAYVLRQMLVLEHDYDTEHNLKTYGEEVSKLLKRYSILKYGILDVAPLHGELWANFLRENSKNNVDEDVLNIITNSPYLPDMYQKIDIKRIENFVKSFIKG